MVGVVESLEIGPTGQQAGKHEGKRAGGLAGRTWHHPGIIILVVTCVLFVVCVEIRFGCHAVMSFVDLFMSC
jgi:hypothetical protein